MFLWRWPASSLLPLTFEQAVWLKYQANEATAGGDHVSRISLEEELHGISLASHFAFYIHSLGCSNLSLPTKRMRLLLLLLTAIWCVHACRIEQRTGDWKFGVFLTLCDTDDCGTDRKCSRFSRRQDQVRTLLFDPRAPFFPSSTLSVGQSHALWCPLWGESKVLR